MRKSDPNETHRLKESKFNKLREAALFRFSVCTEVYEIKIVILPE